MLLLQYKTSANLNKRVVLGEAFIRQTTVDIIPQAQRIAILQHARFSREAVARQGVFRGIRRVL